MNSKLAKFNISLIPKRWYKETIQDNDVQQELVGVITQFQHVDNSKLIINDFYVFNQLKTPHTFTTEVQQRVQKKVKYSYGFGKIKKALNMTLDLGYGDKFINMIDGFIDHKKCSIEETSKENIQVLISDSIVNKHRGRPTIKHIKVSLKSHSRANNSALSLPDPNLRMQLTEKLDNIFASRVPFKPINANMNKDF
ncbi:hypothetical protein C2G38_2291762 [Gigaspora rosea]|uniref:Uncharacterized protein n=1 Tax=Gigaspora rosea TaxID=44941 RepID=A0A397VKZ0_9GLOM|nr:hypothetical protein C2G38_2291762 [Gigaspora rosea]